MRQLAGQVMILLFAMIAPNDGVSYTSHPGSLIWQLHARGRALRMYARGAATGGPGGLWVGREPCGL